MFQLCSWLFFGSRCTSWLNVTCFRIFCTSLGLRLRGHICRSHDYFSFHVPLYERLCTLKVDVCCHSYFDQLLSLSSGSSVVMERKSFLIWSSSDEVSVGVVMVDSLVSWHFSKILLELNNNRHFEYFGIHGHVCTLSLKHQNVLDYLVFWALNDDELDLQVTYHDSKNAAVLSSIEDVSVVSMSTRISSSAGFQHQPAASLRGNPNSMLTDALLVSSIDI